jgi:hypothetical protein
MNRAVGDFADPLLWEDPIPHGDRFVGEWDWKGSTHYMEFRRGRSIAPHLEPIIRFRLPGEMISKQDALASTGLTPLVSERVMGLLAASAGSDVQPIRARIEALDGQVSGFWAINVRKLVDCLDIERSILVRPSDDPDWIQGVKRLALKPDCMGSAQIARIQSYPSLLLVARPLAERLSAARLTGMNLMPVEVAYAHYRG